MKLRIILVGLLAASLGLSAAVAAPPPGKGKPPATGPGCKPKIMVVLKGTLASTPGASATSISVTVKSGNKWGRAYVAASQPLSVAVDSKTKVRRQGKKTLGDLQSGDRVLVQSRVCKADLANNATPALTAWKVIAHPSTQAKNDDDEKKDDNNHESNNHS
jgi:hypothetical protein